MKSKKVLSVLFLIVCILTSNAFSNTGIILGDLKGETICQVEVQKETTKIDSGIITSLTGIITSFIGIITSASESPNKNCGIILSDAK